MSSPGNLGTAKEIYRCGHITLYQNSHSNVFYFSFWQCHLANLGPLQWKHRVLPTGTPGKSPLWWILQSISHFLWWKEEVFMWRPFTLSFYLVGRFTETARVTQLNSSQIPLTMVEQNPSQVLSSEESTESHLACLKIKIHTTPGFTLMARLSLTRPQTTDLSLFLPFLSSFPTMSYTPFRFWY